MFIAENVIVKILRNNRLNLNAYENFEKKNRKRKTDTIIRFQPVDLIIRLR